VTFSQIVPLDPETLEHLAAVAGVAAMWRLDVPPTWIPTPGARVRSLDMRSPTDPEPAAAPTHGLAD